MREQELDALLNDFRAIADERMAGICVTPELKERCMKAASENTDKGETLPFFRRRKVFWGAMAAAAALLIAAVGGAQLFAGGANEINYSMEAAAPESAASDSDVSDDGSSETGNADRDYSGSAMPAPEPSEAPALMAPQTAAGAPSAESGTEETEESPEKGGKHSAGSEDAGNSSNSTPKPTEESEDIAPSEAEEEACADAAESADDGEIIYGVAPENENSADEIVPNMVVSGSANKLSGVTAVFTGQVVSSQILSISLADGSTINVENSLASDLFTDAPEISVGDSEDQSSSSQTIYGYICGQSVYVTVTSYRVSSVSYGSAESGSVIRVIGCSGIIGETNVVAISPVQNSPYGTITIRFDLAADAVAELVTTDASDSGIQNVLDMLE